jgi:hypothetical protein
MKEKYGFVYIWRDRKHNRYYIGCHWGYEDDGYICSSSWMRQAYKHRPNDFKRKILSRIYSNRFDLIDEEYKWLCMIKDNEISKKYYNLNNRKHNHWSSSNKYDDVINKIKKQLENEDKRKKLSEQKIGDKNPMKRKEVSEKVASKNRGRPSKLRGTYRTQEQKDHHSKMMKGKIPHNKGKKLTEEEKIKYKLFEKEKKKHQNKKYYYKPETNECKMFSLDEVIPDGFIRGRSKFNKKSKQNEMF